MKPGYSIQHLKIKERVLPPDAETSEMAAMPVPIDWGVRPPTPKTRGNFVLMRGSIIFQRLHVKIIPEVTPEDENDDDEADSIELFKNVEPVSEEETRPLLPETEQSDYEQPPIPDEELYEEIEDYRTPADAQDIRADLNEQNRSALFRIAASSMISVFLIAIEVFPAFGGKMITMLDVKSSPIMYLIVSLVLFIIVLILQRKAFINGFRAIFSKRFDSDSVFSIASLCIIGHMIAELAVYRATSAPLDGANDPVFRTYAAPMCLACVINDVALLLLNKRVERNFMALTQRRMHHAVMLCQDELAYPELVNSSAQGQYGVIYRSKAKFLSGFMRFSYEQDMCEARFDRLAPYVLFPAVFAAAVGFLISKSVFGALSCFCAVAAAAVPACRLLTSSLPLYFSCARLLGKGVMLSGWAGVDEFGTCSTIAISTADLFPKGSVRLLKAATYSKLPVEEVILHAASLAIAAGGPLADVLSDEINHQYQLLYETEDLAYISEMGLTGYVNSKRVIVGTREMLENRGIEIPGKDFENMRMGLGNRVIYIAIANQFAGALALEYDTDERTQDALQRLVREDVSIVVCTRDPNVTSRLVSDVFGISRRHITVLGINASREYEDITRVVRDRAPSVMSSASDLASFSDSVRATRRLSRSLRLSAILQLVCYTFGILLITGLCCMSGGAIDYFPAKILLVQVLCLVACTVGLFNT